MSPINKRERGFLGVGGRDKLHYTRTPSLRASCWWRPLISQALGPAPHFHTLSHFILTSLLKQPPGSNFCAGKLLWGPEAKLTSESERRGKS